jgi:hypothetical protein
LQHTNYIGIRGETATFVNVAADTICNSTRSIKADNPQTARRRVSPQQQTRQPLASEWMCCENNSDPKKAQKQQPTNEDFGAHQTTFF